MDASSSGTSPAELTMQFGCSVVKLSYATTGTAIRGREIRFYEFGLSVIELIITYMEPIEATKIKSNFLCSTFRRFPVYTYMHYCAFMSGTMRHIRFRPDITNT